MNIKKNLPQAQWLSVGGNILFFYFFFGSLLKKIFVWGGGKIFFRQIPSYRSKLKTLKGWKKSDENCSSQKPKTSEKHAIFRFWNGKKTRKKPVIFLTLKMILKIDIVIKIGRNVCWVPLNLRTKCGYDIFKITDRSVFSRFCAPTEGIFLVWRPWGGPHHIFQVKFCLTY